MIWLGSADASTVCTSRFVFFCGSTLRWLCIKMMIPILCVGRARILARLHLFECWRDFAPLIFDAPARTFSAVRVFDFRFASWRLEGGFRPSIPTRSLGSTAGTRLHHTLQRAPYAAASTMRCACIAILFSESLMAERGATLVATAGWGGKIELGGLTGSHRR